jgi:hypothetical protein
VTKYQNSNKKAERKKTKKIRQRYKKGVANTNNDIDIDRTRVTTALTAQQSNKVQPTEANQQPETTALPTQQSNKAQATEASQQPGTTKKCTSDTKMVG